MWDSLSGENAEVAVRQLKVLERQVREFTIKSCTRLKYLSYEQMESINYIASLVGDTVRGANERTDWGAVATKVTGIMTNMRRLTADKVAQIVRKSWEEGTRVDEFQQLSNYVTVNGVVRGDMPGPAQMESHEYLEYLGR